MGTVKDNMKPTSPENKSFFSGLGWKKKKPSAAEILEAAPKTFVDNVTEAYEALAKLITIKEEALLRESGEEVANTLKVASLKGMQFHLESVLDLASDYEELGKQS
jgi:hypothetical protein